MISDFEHLSMYRLAFIHLLWKDVYSGPLPIFNWVGVFAIEFYDFFLCFGYKTLNKCMVCIFFLFYRLSFHFADGFFCCVAF